MKKFEVAKKIAKRIDFNSRNWNKEIIDRYLLKYDDKRIIESMLIVHLQNDIPRDLTIEVSTMYNCIVGCKFCASGSLKESTSLLLAEDYLRQVDTCLEESNENPNNYPNFYIAFSGIGEPSIAKVEVAKGIELIRKKYSNVQINIATIGFDPTCFNYWNKLNLPIRTLQLPFYSCEDTKLKYIIKNLPEDYNLLKNINEAIEYKKQHNICRIKLNYVVINNVNNSISDIAKMVEYLKPLKKELTIKVSFLNYTQKGKEYKLFSPDTNQMINILKTLKSKEFDCYLFGTEDNTQLGCGQLVQDYISKN